MKNVLRERGETLPGFALLSAAVAGLGWANSPWQRSYGQMLHFKLSHGSGFFGTHLSAHDWVNDGLMAIFFLVVGLEIKREVLEGELAGLGRAALPALAALGGVVVPSLILCAFLWNDPVRLKGWAIPAATDIAFALAALAMLGRAVPSPLRVFLTALAVFDDLAAIAIIAVFYTADLAMPALVAAAACVAALALLNRLRVAWLPIYLAIGVALWCCVLSSGVHATLAGVALALTIPAGAVKKLERALQPYVAFAVLPLFGLFNAGFTFNGLTPAVVLSALPVGIAAALFLGKQFGIFTFAWIAVKAGVTPLPPAVTWRMMYGVALLGGIGFTMSFFIGSLAYYSADLLAEAKIGVFSGSLLSAAAGYFVLRAAVAQRRTATPRAG